MASTEGQRSFSWKRAALHVALALVLVIVAGGVLAAAFELDDAEKLGQQTGRLLLPGLLMTLLASYMIQSGRRLYSWLFGSLAFLAVVGAVGTPVLKQLRTHAIPLTDAERAPLEVIDIGGVEHFRHPTFRFAFPRSRGFERSLEAEVAVRSAVPEHPAAYIYPLAAGHTDDAMLFLVIEKWNRVERDRLETLIDGLSRLGGVSDEQSGRVVWEPSFRGAELHYTVGEDGHVRVGAWVDSFGLPDAELIVALIGFSSGEDLFADVVPGFRYR